MKPLAPALCVGAFLMADTLNSFSHTRYGRLQPSYVSWRCGFAKLPLVSVYTVVMSKVEKETEPKKFIGLHVAPETIVELKRIARSNDRSMAAEARRALEAHVERKGKAA